MPANGQIDFGGPSIALAELTILASREECARNRSNRDEVKKQKIFANEFVWKREREEISINLARTCRSLKRVNVILKFHAVEIMGKNPVRRLRSGIRVRGRCTLQ